MEETRFLIGKNAKMSIGERFHIYSGSDIRIFENEELTIGSGYLNAHNQIVCTEKITIGEEVAIAREVIIRDTDAHNILDENHKKTKPVTIGDGVIIAAGAFVTKDVPENCIATGVLAKIIRTCVKWE